MSCTILSRQDGRFDPHHLRYIKYSALSPDTTTWQLLATESKAGEGYLEVNPHSLGLLSGTIIVLTQGLHP